MSATLVAHATGTPATGNDPATTTAIDTTGATFIVLCAGSWNSNGLTFSDSAGNTWTTGTALGTVGSFNGRFAWCFHPTTSATHTFTVTGANSGQSFVSIAAQAWSGMASSALDGQNGAAYATSAAPQPGSLTPANNGDLIVAFVSDDSATAAPTIDSGFTQSDTITKSSAFEGLSMAYLLQATAAAINPTWTLAAATSGVAGIAAFSFTSGSGTDATVDATTLSGTGDLVAPAVSGTRFVIVAPPPLDGTGDLVAPTATATRFATVTAVPLDGTGDLIAPSSIAAGSGVMVNATTLSGTGDLIAPSVLNSSTLPDIDGPVTLTLQQHAPTLAIKAHAPTLTIKPETADLALQDPGQTLWIDG